MSKDKNPVRTKAMDQIMTAWDDCEAQFNNAIADNPKKRGQVVFAVNIDRAEQPPSVHTKISFKDRDMEGGLSVSKTFSKTIGGEVEDDDQMPLEPLASETSPSRLFEASEPNGEAAPSVRYAVGDSVAWSSNGKPKEGKVIEVVEADFPPSEENTPKDCTGKKRDHESYIINIPNLSGKGRGTNYWPLVSKLQRVEVA